MVRSGETKPTPPSAPLWHLPHFICASSPRATMKNKMPDHPVKLSNLGVNEISTRDLQEARKLIFTFDQGEFEPMSPDLKV